MNAQDFLKEIDKTRTRLQELQGALPAGEAEKKALVQESLQSLDAISAQVEQISVAYDSRLSSRTPQIQLAAQSMIGALQTAIPHASAGEAARCQAFIQDLSVSGYAEGVAAAIETSGFLVVLDVLLRVNQAVQNLKNGQPQQAAQEAQQIVSDLLGDSELSDTVAELNNKAISIYGLALNLTINLPLAQRSLYKSQLKTYEVSVVEPLGASVTVAHNSRYVLIMSQLEVRKEQIQQAIQTLNDFIKTLKIIGAILGIFSSITKLLL